MWATLPLLCAGAWLLGVPVCGAAELCVNSLVSLQVMDV
uniref:Cathepsin H n=1 Tax=Homo sapiens TaxID=9606 RepID=E9PN60_HUMAN